VDVTEKLVKFKKVHPSSFATRAKSVWLNWQLPSKENEEMDSCVVVEFGFKIGRQVKTLFP
jgi:hypothetical protein